MPKVTSMDSEVIAWLKGEPLECSDDDIKAVEGQGWTTWPVIAALSVDQMLKVLGPKGWNNGHCTQLTLEAKKRAGVKESKKELKRATGITHTKEKKRLVVGKGPNGDIKHWCCDTCGYDLEEYVNDYGGDVEAMKFCPNSICGIEFEEKKMVVCVKCAHEIVKEGVCPQCGLNHKQVSEEDQRIILYLISVGKRGPDIDFTLATVKANEQLKAAALKTEAKGGWLAMTQKGNHPFLRAGR